jgi:hypothetical protein
MHVSSSTDRLDSEPYVINEVRFEASRMLLKQILVVAVEPCGDVVGSYEVQLLPDGKLKIVAIEEECRARANHTALTFDPVP